MATQTAPTLVETMPRDGLHRYLYEHMIAQALDEASRTSADAGGPQLTVKHRNMLRDQIAERIGQYGQQMGLTDGIDDSNMTYGPVVAGINDVISRTYPNQPAVFDVAPGTNAKDNPAVKRMFGDFMRMTQFGGKSADEFDARLPLSPHDPRWRGRAHVMRAGLEPVAIPLAELQRYLKVNSLRGVDSIKRPMNLVYAQPREGQFSLNEAGLSNTYADSSGFSRLRPYMSSDEASRLEQWAHAGARTPDGKIDSSKFMDEAAVDRAVAVLEDVTARGVSYTIERDKHPGQLKLRLDSGINMRIMDTANRQSYVANSIYHHDKKYSYSIKTNSSNKREGRYTPSSQESVNLLRLAEGSLEIDGVYHTNDSSIYPMGVVQNSADAGQNGRDLRIKCGYRNELTQFFKDHDAAETAVRGYVDNAHENLEKELGAEQMIALAGQQRNALRLLKANALGRPGADGQLIPEDDLAAARAVLEAEPEFSLDSNVEQTQRMYWAQLSDTFPDMSDVPEDARAAIPEPVRLRPRDVVIDERVAAGVEVDGDDGTAITRGYETRNLTDEFGVYPVPEDRSIVSVENAERALRAHAEAYLVQRLGAYEPDETNTRFDPVVVSRYADPGNVRETRSNMVAAMRLLPEIEPAQFMGDDFGRDRIVEEMISFDADTAQSMFAHEHPQMRMFAGTIQRALEANGCDLTTDDDGNPNLYVDDMGVVSYEARRRNAKDRAVVRGEIGQVLTQGEHGEVYTKFAHGNDHMFVPGYTATILPQKIGETKGIAERAKLRGFEQTVNDHLTRIVSDQVNTSRDRTHDPATLNRAYRELYGHKFPVDYFEQTAEEGLSEKWQLLNTYTESRRVHFGKEIGDGASLRSKVMAERHGRDPLNDNTRDPLVLTGGEDITTLDAEDYDGYFSPSATGTARNHGRVVYLVDSAEVGEDGMIVRGESGDDIALLKDEALKYSKFDPHSRQNMMLSATLQASSINENTTIAQMNFRDWGHEDGMMVSKHFAETNKIRGIDGNMRSLTRADKASDTHGNKGVINYVIDPDMPDDEAERLDLVEEVQFFRENRHVDVVVSPYSGMSRQNAGLAREMIDSKGKGAQSATLNGEIVDGKVGTGTMIITHMSADKKTNIYDDQAVREGKGRKISNNLIIGMQSLGLDKTIQHLFKDNDPNVKKAKAFIEATGIKIDGTTDLEGSFDAEAAAERTAITPGDTSLVQYTKDNVVSKHARKTMRQEAMAKLREGDMMQLPFAVTTANGEDTPKIGVDANGNDVYGLPILPEKYRSDEELHDGTVSMHEYTDKYAEMYMAAMEYEAAREQMVGATGREQQRLQEMQANCIRRAQGNHDVVSTDIVDNKINGKHNVLKDAMMTARAENSATAVWTADPRLKLNQVAMPREMAEQLGVFENGTDDCVHDNSVGHTMMWRDPVWSGNGLRYMEVVIDDTLTGAAVHPRIVKCFDGDFDGDAPGLKGNFPKDVHDELIEKATVEANLLNEGASVTQPDGTERYELNVSTEMAFTAACAMDKGYAEMVDEITTNLNEVRNEFIAGEIDKDSMRETQRVAMSELDEVFDQAARDQFGTNVIDFSNPEAHVKSMKQCFQWENPDTGEVVEHNAKGNAGKYVEYMQRFGVEEVDGEIIDRGHSLVSKEDHEAEQKAMGIKTESVGDAGTKQHMAVALLRGQNLVNEAAHISYGATQSILQAKKDPVDAIYREEIVSTAVPNLWSGYKMTSSTNEQGRLVWDVVHDKGEPVMATKDEWVQQYVDMYGSKQGMGVPVAKDLIRNAAEALSDENGQMYNLTREHWDAMPESKQPLAIDRVAFGGRHGFDELVKASKEGKTLLDGTARDLATRKVREMQDQRAMDTVNVQQPQAAESVPEPERTVEEDEFMAAQEAEAFAQDQERYAEVEEQLADGNIEAAEAAAGEMSDAAVSRVRAQRERQRATRVHTQAQTSAGDDGMSL